MEEKYTLELTLDELKIVSRALTREYDRLDDLGSPLLKDVEPLEDRVHEMYINARRKDISESVVAIKS